MEVYIKSAAVFSPSFTISRNFWMMGKEKKSKRNLSFQSHLHRLYIYIYIYKSERIKEGADRTEQTEQKVLSDERLGAKL